jgi:hypothetical protein
MINKLMQLWNNDEIPLDYGLHRSDGSFAPISHEYRVESQIGQTDYSLRSDIGIILEYSDDNYRIVAGDTSWESDAYICLFDRKIDQIIWVLHLCEAESPKEIKIVNGWIECLTYYYPIGKTIRINIEKPELIEVETKCEY